jgi:hypothetical protein
MKSTAISVTFSVLFALASSNIAQAGPSGIPELCQWYPSSAECSCNVNPYNVYCGSAGWGGAIDTRDDQVPPDPEHIYIHVTKTSNNPYTATCWSSSTDRYNYAYWEILHGWANGDADALQWAWGSKWLFVVYSDNTLSEGYAHSPGYAELWQESLMQACGRPPLPGQVP